MVVKAIFNSTIFKLLVFIIQLATLIVVARMFSPAELGAVAVLLICFQFFLLIVESGIGSAVIASDASLIQLQRAFFGFSILVTLAVSSLFYPVASLLLSLYAIEGFDNGVLILTISLLIYGFGVVPSAWLKKDLKFKTFGLIELVAEVAGFFLIAYYLLNNSEAPLEVIFIKYLLSFSIKLIFVLMIVVYSGKAEIPCFSILKVRQYWGYISNLVMFNILNYMARSVDSLVVGKMFGLQVLGYYDRAYQLTRYPVTLVAAGVGPALLATLAKGSPGNAFAVVMRVVKLLAVVSTLAATFLMMFSEDFVVLLFGSEWHGAAYYLSVFAIGLPALIMQGIVGSILQYYHRTNELLMMGVLSLSCNLVAVAIAHIVGGVFTLIFSLVFFQWVVFSISYLYVFKRYFKVSLFTMKVVILMSLYLFVVCVALFSTEMVLIGKVGVYLVLASSAILLWCLSEVKSA